MNDSTNTSGFTGFKPGADRQLLADVHRWARTNGWNWHECWGWVNAPYASEATLAVEWDDAGVLTIRRGPVVFRPTRYDVDSVRQAIDMLVALDILPAHLSSQYQAGANDGRAFAAAARGGHR
ncbi:hypothetical protein [Micromonospora sp. DPT]|uniref:hypothetical protein n=1 Tax=Micromonospora sp. DPT TaxID=3142975 RepID=UPI0032095CC9